MNTPIPEGELSRIRDALFRGHKIQAIKLYRAGTGAGLVEAKTAIEGLEAELRAASPEKFTVPASGKGCLGVAVALCVVVVTVILWLVRS
jgi:signal transduction histidine kinase